MRKKTMLIVAAMPLLAGCFGYKPFQPNPYEYERWSKPDDSEFAIRKAMLECGYPSPNGVRDRMISLSTTPDEIVLMYKCMSNSGYLYDGKKYNVCQHGYADVVSCKPGAVAPERKVSRRLDSRFCRAFPNADACEP
jgi:hypothetical protein